MKLAVLTCGMLPIPAVRGGAVENLIDFYLEYNDRKKIHHITVYSPWDIKLKEKKCISSDVNHYCYIDVTSLKARIERRIYKYLHKNEYYNYFIEYYFEKVYSDLKNKKYDYILLENSPGLAYKLSERGYKNILLHLHNDLLNSHSHCHEVIARNIVKVITVSNYIKKSVSTVYPCKNIYTVYNGIDTMLFSQKNKSCLLLTGDESQIATGIRNASCIYGAIRSLNNTNLGVIGKPSDWLIASQVDYQLVKEKYGVNLIDIPMLELEIELKKNEPSDIPHYDQLVKRFKNKETLDGALKFYSALRRIITRYNLSGFTLRCFDLLGPYKNTACLAFGLLNEQGITAACEGDVPSLLTMHFVRALTNMPSFQSNPSSINFAENSILFAHCTLPLNMVQKYTLTTHFESGLGIGIKGEMPLGKVSVLKLAPSLKCDDSVTFSGTIKKNLSLPNYCRTQIEVEPEDGGMFSIIKDNFGNHIIITYADCVGSFITLLNLYDAKYDNLHKEEKKDK